QDYDLLLRLGERGRLANLDDVLTKCRVALDGVSSRRRREQVKWAEEALRRARARRGLPPLDGPMNLWTSDDRADFVENWTREAFRSGYYSTSRRYAWRLVRMRPSRSALRLLIRAAIEEARAARRRELPAVEW